MCPLCWRRQRRRVSNWPRKWTTWTANCKTQRCESQHHCVSISLKNISLIHFLLSLNIFCDYTPVTGIFCIKHSMWLFSFAGFAAGGDTSETEPKRPNPPTRGGQEHFAGAAGGGWGGTTQPGEAAAVGAGSGKVTHRNRYCCILGDMFTYTLTQAITLSVGW